MDYHTLPRRQLQTLCKKHGIPANAANTDMADALTALLKRKPELHADTNSRQALRRATRGCEAAIGETASKTKDVQEESRSKTRKPTISHNIIEEELNRKPERMTRGRGTACFVSEAPVKTDKTLASGETESSSATNKQQEAKRDSMRNGHSKQSNIEMPRKTAEDVDLKVLIRGETGINSTSDKISTRNGARKQINSEMRTDAEEDVDLKAVSLKSDKKKEIKGGIVLRRGRIKVQSRGNLSKSPESERAKAVTTEVESRSNKSCFVDAKKTRKKKRSVTFSDVLEINSVCVENHPSRDLEEPAKETVVGNLLGTDPSFPEGANSALIAKRVIGTRKGSRSVSTKDCAQDVIVAQGDEFKGSKKPVTKASKAKGLHAFDAGKTADIENDGQSDRKKSARGKTSNSVGKAGAKANEEEKVADDVIKGYHMEDVPCLRRSRRLTIVPTDVKVNQDMQLSTEQLDGVQPQNRHEGNSILRKKTDDALLAEMSCKSRRKTLAPLEMNHAQSNLLSPSKEKQKRVSKAKDTQSKADVSELNDEALQSKQKCSELKACDTTSVATQAQVAPMKNKEALSLLNICATRKKALVASKEVSNKMGFQNICIQEIISEKLENNVHTIETEKADCQAPFSNSFDANSEPHSLLEVSNDAKGEVDIVKAISVTPRSTGKISKVSTCPDDGTTVSQEMQTNIEEQEGLVFEDEIVVGNVQDSEDLDVIDQAYVEQPQGMQKNIEEQEGSVFVDEAVVRNVQDSEDLDVIDQAYTEKSHEILVLKNADEPRVEDPVNNTFSNEDINHGNTVSKVFEIVTGKEEGQNQIDYEDAKSCDEEFVCNRCPPTTHHATCDSETANSSPLIGKLDAADVECHVFIEETPRVSSSEFVQNGHEFATEKGLDILKQGGDGMDELASIISLSKDINEKSTSDFPVSIIIQDNDNLDGNHHMKCNDLENITDIQTDEGITASSPGVIMESKFKLGNCRDIDNCTDERYAACSPIAIVESTFKHQKCVGIATADQELCMPEVHLLTFCKDKTANLTSGGTADFVEKHPNQVVGMNLGGEAAVDIEDMGIHDDLWKEQLQDTNEGVPCDEVKSVHGLSKTDDQLGQLSLLSSSCSAEPGAAMRKESIRKTKQRCPRSIFKSARKARSLMPWEDRNLEQNTATPPNKDDSLDSLDMKYPEIWGLDSHEVSCDEVDSASSEEEESSAETDETISDIELCNTEQDYSCNSEDDIPSEIEEDTMSDSEGDFSGMEGQLLSGEEECYESEVLDTSEEESSECEDDAEDSKTYPVSQLVAYSGSFNALCMTAGLKDQVATVSSSDSKHVEALCIMHSFEDQQVAIIAPSKLSHADYGINQPETVNHLALAYVTNGSVPHADPTDVDEKNGLQHEKSSTPSVSGIQENVDVQRSHGDCTAMERVQSANVSTCEESESLAYLSSLFVTPAPKVKEVRVQATNVSACEDTESLACLASLFATPAPKVKEVVKCSLVSPSIGILESNISQLSGALETKLNSLPDSGQEEGVQLCSPCELLHQDAIPEVEQHTLDETKHGFEVCKSVSGVEKELEFNGQMVELDETSVENSHAGPTVVDCYMASPILNDLQNSSKTDFISGNQIKQIHTGVSETPCLGYCELIIEGNAAEIGDPDICEDGIQNMDTSPMTNVQEEQSILKIIQVGIEIDEGDNGEAKNIHENNEVSVGMALDAQNGSEHFSEQVDLREGPEAMGEKPEVICSENNVERLAYHCSTPKCSEDSESLQVFNHESLNEAAETSQNVEIQTVNAQVEELHEKPLDESQCSEASNKDKEAAVDYNISSKEQSMKQIDLTLLSVRKLRQMCKENPMFAKKKMADVTPAKKPWKSSTKEVHQPNTSVNSRDLPLLSVRKLRQMCNENPMSAKKKTANVTPAKKPWMSGTKQVHQPNTSVNSKDLPSVSS